MAQMEEKYEKTCPEGDFISSLLFFLAPFFFIPDFTGKQHFLFPFLFLAGAILVCIIISFCFSLLKTFFGEEYNKTFAVFFSGITLFLLSFVPYFSSAIKEEFLFFFCTGVLFFFFLSFKLPQWEKKEKEEENFIYGKLFSAMAAGLSGGILFAYLPIAEEIRFSVRIFSSFAPLLLLIQYTFSIQEENKKKTGKILFLIFILICGGTGDFFIKEKIIAQPAKKEVSPKEDPDPGRIILAGSIAAGQFTRPVTIFLYGNQQAGSILQKSSFPARLFFCTELAGEQKLFDNRSSGQERSSSPPETENQNKKADIILVCLKDFSFPENVFLTQRMLFSLRKKFKPGGGVFALLLPDKDKEKIFLQNIFQRVFPLLGSLYANILYIPEQKMFLASNLPLVTDPEILEENLQEGSRKKMYFPEGFLQIFAPELKKSLPYERKEGEKVKNIPYFSWLLPAPGGSDMDHFLFRIPEFFTALYRPYRYFFWILFLPLYFIFRYFYSPGGKRKRKFFLFEHAFFLTSFPLVSLLSFPEKWSINAFHPFLLLLPAFLSFFFIFFRKDTIEEEEKEKGKYQKYFSFLTRLFPFSPFLLFIIFAEKNDGIFSLLFPRGIQPYTILLPLLFFFLGVGCSSSLAHTLKNTEQKEFPGILLWIFSGMILACCVTFPLAYGGLYIMLPLLVFMTLLRGCIYWKK